MRKTLIIGGLLWAVVGAAVALASLGEANDDARLLVGLATVAGPLAAAGAAGVLRQAHDGTPGNDRAAGALLLFSVITPTYFAAALNLPALVIGVLLLITPELLLRSGATATRA